MLQVRWLGLVVTAGFVWCFQAQAATVSPDSVTLVVEPGHTVHQIISFENDTEATENYVLNLQAVSFAESADDLRFSALDQEQKTWISLDRQLVTIEPGATETVKVAVAVPGGIVQEVLMFAVIAMHQTGAQPGVGVAQGIATLVFVEIGNQSVSSLHLETFEVVPKNSHQLPLRLAALVINQGAGLLEPELFVVIKNIWGKEIEVMSLNPTERRLPGNTYRVFSEEWQGSAWRFGWYTAQLFIVQADNSQPDFATTSVVLFPWRTLGIFGASGLILVTATYVLFRARRR